MRQVFEIGQSVRLITPLPVGNGGGGDYVVVRRNDLESTEPNYVIESAVDRRLRREPHSRLMAIAVQAAGTF